ncbi:MAG: hypothetical protein Q4C70_12495, partial [Planctomycetia bacterium]|nr:hypothetical protein [Planctomycetia bacterium]
MSNSTPQDPNRRPVTPQPVKPTGVQPLKPQSVKPAPVKPTSMKQQSVKPQPMKPASMKPQSVKPTRVSADTPLTETGKKRAGNRPLPVAPEPVVLSEEALSFSAEMAETKVDDFLPQQDKYLAKTIQVEEKEEEKEELTDKIAKGAPPWFISTIGHVILLLIFALLFTAIPPKPQPIRIEAMIVVEEEEVEEEEEIFAEDIGVQTEIETETFVETEEPEAAEMAEEDTPVEDPMLEPEAPPVTETGTLAASLKEAPPGARFDGRNPGGRKGLLGKYGGTKSTEDAVELGLKWLAKQQDKARGANKGSWSLSGPYSGGLEGCENRVSATAMALLAFQGAGYTQHPPKFTDEDRESKKRYERKKKEIKEVGKYRRVIADGWNWLLKQQGTNGQFFPMDGMYNHSFYTHAQATIALCELYGMTKVERYRVPAQKAVKFLLDTQHNDGAWRYTLQKDEMSDMSVTGWVLMALQSARMAGIEVPQEALDGITRYLDANSAPNDKTFYRYTVQEVYPSMTMTAEGILCRQYLGWEQNDPRVEKALDRVLTENVSFKGETDVYKWYYATQAMHHKEGRWWKEWNGVMRQELPKNQVRTGPEAGSWSPNEDRYASDQGGRLYMTCLSIYMLEVYYRHLPIYAKLFDESGKMNLEAVPDEAEKPAENEKPTESADVEKSVKVEDSGTTEKESETD